jgi:hypothetical protein
VLNPFFLNTDETNKFDTSAEELSSQVIYDWDVISAHLIDFSSLIEKIKNSDSSDNNFSQR